MIEPLEWRCHCSSMPLLWRRRTHTQRARLAGGDLNSPPALRLQSCEAADLEAVAVDACWSTRVSICLSLDLAAVAVIRLRRVIDE